MTFQKNLFDYPDKTVKITALPVITKTRGYIAFKTFMREGGDYSGICNTCNSLVHTLTIVYIPTYCYI